MGTVKRDILDEIRRTAKENGGIVLGEARFFRETGLNKRNIYEHWNRWSEAVKEAGLEPNELNASKQEEKIETIASFIKENGRFPQSADLYRAVKLDAFTYFGGKIELARKVVEFCKGKPKFKSVAPICEEIISSPQLQTSNARSSLRGSKSIPNGYVYLVKEGKYYKIGRTSNLPQRIAKLKQDTAQPREPILEIKCDKPELAEEYWKNRFSEKHVKGEWFELTSHDVRLMKKIKAM